MKFKHKTLNIIATKLKDSELYEFSYDNFDSCYMPIQFFMGSNDWIEIVEKDYEILTFKKNGIVYNNKESHKYLIRGDFSIHSVKRLSDGEIFTIGDSVKNTNGIFNIVEFECTGNSIIINSLYATATHLRCINKVKQPLFITEDGVDIYEGAQYYGVLSDYSLRIWKANSISSKKVEWIKDFSTKKAAENYIKCNKPCLSLNDVLGECEKVRFNSIDERHNLKDYLTKLVKTRVKQD